MLSEAYNHTEKCMTKKLTDSATLAMDRFEIVFSL